MNAAGSEIANPESLEVKASRARSSPPARLVDQQAFELARTGKAVVDQLAVAAERMPEQEY
jgi:hypothetical protein